MVPKIYRDLSALVSYHEKLCNEIKSRGTQKSYNSICIFAFTEKTKGPIQQTTH